MQLEDADALDTARRLVETLPAGAEVILCPSFTALPGIAAIVRGSAVHLGAQDCAGQERGALTGEVSPEDLVHIGCRFVIVGHSERRQHLGETDAMIAEKIRAAVAAGLRPILCVGETFDERQRGQREAVVRRQLAGALTGVDLAGVPDLVLAYEPVWAIGTGHPATPDDAAKAHALIAAVVHDLRSVAETEIPTRLLYGGSVDVSNVATFLATPGIDGVLVGTASQTAARFRAIVYAART